MCIILAIPHLLGSPAVVVKDAVSPDPLLSTICVCQLSVTDAAILEMPESTPKLSSLNLRGCKNFSEMGLTFLKTATSLTCLKIAGCNQVCVCLYVLVIVLHMLCSGARGHLLRDVTR